MRFVRRGTIFLLALVVIGCGSSPATPDAGQSAADAGVDAGTPDAGTLLGNLKVKWTVDGSDANHSTVCPSIGVTFWSVLALDPTTNQELGSLGVDCVAGIWDSGSILHGIRSGSTRVRVEAHSGTPFSGPLRAMKEMDVIVSPSDGGVETVVTIPFLGTDF